MIKKKLIIIKINNHINKWEDETQFLAYHTYFVLLFHLFIFIEQCGLIVALKGKSYVRLAGNLLLFKCHKWEVNLDLSDQLLLEN